MATTEKPRVRDWAWGIVKRTLHELAGVRVGTVTIYDPLKATATVQPVRQRFIYGKPQPMPLVVDAPVCWWRFGGMVLQGDLEVGDQVLLVNLERSIAEWWTTGLPGPSTTERMHNRADVVVLPWIQSLVVDASTHGGPTVKLPGSFRMGRVDNLAGITMHPAKTSAPTDQLTVELEGLPIKAGKTAASFALKGTEIAVICGTPAGPPLSIAFILNAVPAASDPATVIALANANKAAILALCGALTGNLTVKLVVE